MMPDLLVSVARWYTEAILIFFFAQRTFIQGITLTGIKG